MYKRQFGILDGELILIDEMHTPDSSRFWSKADYDQNPATAEQIDKEFVRQWMLANKVNGEVPTTLSEEVVIETSKRYREILKIVTGEAYQIPTISSKERMLHNLCANKLMLPKVVHIVHSVDTDGTWLSKLATKLQENNTATNSLVASDSILTNLSVYSNSLDQATILAIDLNEELRSSLHSIGMPMVEASVEDDLNTLVDRLI